MLRYTGSPARATSRPPLRSSPIQTSGSSGVATILTQGVVSCVMSSLHRDLACGAQACLARWADQLRQLGGSNSFIFVPPLCALHSSITFRTQFAPSTITYLPRHGLTHGGFEILDLEIHRALRLEPDSRFRSVRFFKHVNAKGKGSSGACFYLTPIDRTVE